MSGNVPVVVRRFLVKADEELELAKLVFKSSTSHAAKFAYMAAFHAAQAALIAYTGDAPKTHKGVRNAFAALSLSTEGLGKDLGRFLARSYAFKDSADYKLEAPLAEDEAREAMKKAAELVKKVRTAVTQA